MYKLKKADKNVINWLIKIFFLIGYLFMEFITEGTSYYHEFESLVILSIFLFGSFYCGHICPYGIISELFGKLGVLILGEKRKKIQIPKSIDSKLRYLKYVFGILFLYIFISGTADYWGDHGVMYKSTAITKAYLFVKMLLGISLLSLFFDRFFCRYLCYQKAWYNIIEFFSLTKIERVDSTCSSCKICKKDCPMSIDVSTKNTIKSNEDCISCYKCVSDCPTKSSALKIKFFGIKIKPFNFIVIVSLTYFILSWIWLIFDVEVFIRNF